MSIRSYRNDGTRDIAEELNSKESRKTLPRELHQIAHLKLVLLNSADSLLELSTTHGLGLEKLRKDRAGQYSIRINRKYRICFLWTGSDAEGVEITDYH